MTHPSEMKQYTTHAKHDVTRLKFIYRHHMSLRMKSLHFNFKRNKLRKIIRKCKICVIADTLVSSKYIGFVS